VLVGRDAELEELCAAAAAALARGRGLLALVCGDAGIGKTRLAAEVAERLAAEGVAVAWAACRQDGGAPPYWPWAQLLSRLGRRDALETDDAGAPDLARFALFEAVAAALGEAAPVLLVLDDLHWADRPSLRLLDALGAHVGPAPVLVLGTYRDTEPGAAALAGIAADRRLVLRGLAAADLGDALAEATGETVAPDTVAALHGRTGGNPFFAAEVVRLRRAEGPAAAASVPVSVRAVLDRRIDRLPPGAETVLRAAAVLDPAATAGVDTVLLAGVAGVAPVTLPELLAPATEAGLVVAATPGAGRHRLAHALVADTLTARTPPAQRLVLHRAAASLLGRRADAGVGDAAEVAHQQLAAARLSGEPDEARAAAQRCAAAARTAVERTAYEDAVGRLQDALAVLAGVPGGPDRGALLCALGEAALAAGDPAGARRAFAEAAARARHHDQPELLAAAALGLTGGAAGFEVDLGDPDRVAPLEQALTALPDADSGLRSAVAARLSVALAFTPGEPRRRALADTAVAMARRLDDPRALAVALAARCDALAGPDHVAARDRMAGEIVTAARTAGDRTLELLGRRLQVVALTEAGRWPQVDIAIDAYARVAEPLRLPGLTWYVPLWRGSRATMRGDRAAEDDHGAQLRHRVQRSGSGNAELLALTQRFVREVLAGQGFDIGFDVGFARFVELSPDIAATAAQGTTALLHALSGETDARALLRSFLAARAGDPVDSEWLPERVQGAMTAVLVGDREAAEAVYEALAPYPGLFAGEGIFAGTWGCVDAHLGRLARLLGRTAAARRHFAAACELDAAAGAALGVRTARWAADDGPGAVTGDDGARVAVAAERDAGGSPAHEAVTDEAVFRRDGDVWTLAYAGRAVRLRDAKGLRDLAALLARPGRELAVHELVGSPVPGADGIEQADRTAIAAYRRRLAELEEDRAEAAAMHDPVRAERATAERDALLHELAAVTGLGGRVRRGGSDAERMRKAVGNRIRQAVGRIEQIHPELGRHLRVSVRTGTFCRYEPDRAVRWRL
jgi:hypothetical protein